MAYVITDKCTACGKCKDACPVEAISEGTPCYKIDPDACIDCGACTGECGSDAINYDESGLARIDETKCTGCGRCIGACNFDAIANPNWHSNEILSKKMAEYTLAVVQGRPHFHINIVTQVSPFCDCHGENDIPIIPDVGMFASFDPVAVDQAAADACNKQPVLDGSLLSENLKKSTSCRDHFTDLSPNTNWRDTLAHAEKLGIGTRAYELTRV